MRGNAVVYAEAASICATAVGTGATPGPVLPTVDVE
jgi:hypothetical protein